MGSRSARSELSDWPAGSLGSVPGLTGHLGGPVCGLVWGGEVSAGVLERAPCLLYSQTVGGTYGPGSRCVRGPGALT